MLNKQNNVWQYRHTTQIVSWGVIRFSFKFIAVQNVQFLNAHLFPENVHTFMYIINMLMMFHICPEHILLIFCAFLTDMMIFLFFPFIYLFWFLYKFCVLLWNLVRAPGGCRGRCRRHGGRWNADSTLPARRTGRPLQSHWILPQGAAAHVPQFQAGQSPILTLLRFSS